jgi:hypothetical protein
MKFFNIDLHISIIADMKKIFNDIGHEVFDLSLSEHTWVFNRVKDSVPMLDNSRWMSLSPEQFSEEFYEYRENEHLKDADAFIVTYPPTFSLLYKKYKKPIIINNPIRYEWPFSFRTKDWNYFNDYLRDGVDNGFIYLVANNLYDKYYMEHFIEREVEHIPSICDYYKTYYTENDNSFLYYSRDKVTEFTNPKISYKDDLYSKHTHFDLVKHRGIIHLPYQISYMSIFEQYTSNIPLFIPTKELLFDIYKTKKYNVLKEVSWNGYFNQVSKSFINYKGKHDPNNYLDLESVEFWIQYADFYDSDWMPHIIYFSSLEELNTLVDTVDVNDISNKMKSFNKLRTQKIYDMWSSLINKINKSK